MESTAESILDTASEVLIKGRILGVFTCLLAAADNNEPGICFYESLVRVCYSVVN